MKIIIKTPSIEIEYSDECTTLYKGTREQIEQIIKTALPIHIHSPVVGTVEEIFNTKK